MNHNLYFQSQIRHFFNIDQEFALGRSDEPSIPLCAKSQTDIGYMNRCTFPFTLIGIKSEVLVKILESSHQLQQIREFALSVP
jgi:hypothetical protein